MDDLENMDWINARDMNRRVAKPVIPTRVDEEVSQIVGRKVLVNDPQMIKLIAKWKRSKTNEDEPDNFLKDGAKVRELQETLNPERFKNEQNQQGAI